MGRGMSSLATLNEAENGALVSGRGENGQVFTGSKTLAKGPGQVDKGKVEPRAVWAQGRGLGCTVEPPEGCRTLRAGPEGQMELSPQEVFTLGGG